MRDLLGLSDPPARGGQVLLVADDGHVIYDSAGGLTGQQVEGLSLAAGGSRSRGAGSGAAGPTCTRRSARRTPSGRLGCSFRWPRLPARCSRTGLVVLVLCIGAVLLIGGDPYIVTRRVTRPLERMARTMARIEQGEFGVRVPITPTHDEVGRLSPRVQHHARQPGTADHASLRGAAARKGRSTARAPNPDQPALSLQHAEQHARSVASGRPRPSPRSPNRWPSCSATA